MNPSRPTPLIALGLAGVVAGFLLERGLAAAGLPMLVPPATLPATLIIIGGIVVALAVPIRRAIRGSSATRIDPFRALRVAVLAKAAGLSGALLTGGCGGILVYMLTRTVLPSRGSLALGVAAVVGAIVLLVGGLIAERLCTLPPDEPQEDHAPEA